MSASQSTFSSPEPMSDFVLYIPNLVRAELCLGLFINNISTDSVRLIFKTRADMLAMAAATKHRVSHDSVGSNDKAVIVRVNLPENKGIGPISELSKIYPKPQEDKSENISAIPVASNFRVKVPNVVSSELLVDKYSGLPQTNKVILKFNSEENMLSFVNELKANPEFENSLVFDSCKSDEAVGIRLRLEESNRGVEIFTFLSTYFINLETLAYNQKLDLKASANLARATANPVVAEESGPASRYHMK